MNNKDELMRARAYITAKLPQGELLTQLAEEAAELTHAALKLRRALDGANPTPISQKAAMASLLEEVADVMLLVELLQLNEDEPFLRGAMAYKTLRWKSRLEAMR